MAMTLTEDRKQLRRDAIKLRQDLGWNNTKIGKHLDVPRKTVAYWLKNLATPTSIILADSNNTGNNSTLNSGSNSNPLLNKVNVMDCVTGLNRLPHNHIDLIFADPPYNIGIAYNNGEAFTDRQSDYYDISEGWFRAMYRVLKDGGSLYIMQYSEICANWLPRLKAVGFVFQRWLIWHYPTNIGQSPNNWTRSHRTILFVTKGENPAHFNGLADPQPYRNPTDKRIIENLKERPGVTPYDAWSYDDSILQYNLVKNVSKDKTEWPNQIPVPLIERVIKTSCPPNGIVCDPFMGSGSTAVASVKTKHPWYGFDLSEESPKVTEKRIGQL
jgi:site-specific DNA-methyltransferase (adenine-specific)